MCAHRGCCCSTLPWTLLTAGRYAHDAQLEDESYNAKSSRQMTKTLSTIITNRVKALKYERYKIVTIVTVGEIANQGVRVASRCVMDQATDNYASGSYKNSSLFGVATVYAMYYE